ncbi:MAG: hypothetical protein AB1782_17275 [Cyanobacteriota bacterium]
MKEVSVREYANMVGLSTTAVRKQIEKGKLATCKKTLGGKEIIHILIDVGYQPTNHVGEPVKTESYQPVDNHEEPVQDAEIIRETPQYNIVNMETSTFEQLIQNIKDLADDRSKAEQDSYQKLYSEYFELKQEIKLLRDNNEKLKIESIQASAELKISQITINELKEKFCTLENTYKELINKIESQKETPKDTNKESIWSKTLKL